MELFKQLFLYAEGVIPLNSLKTPLNVFNAENPLPNAISDMWL